MLQQVAKGSKEELTVLITDNNDTPMTDLSGTTPKYDIIHVATDLTETFKRGNGTFAGAVAASATGMKIRCAVDHNDAGVAWIEGDYKLFVWFVVDGGSVRKGPYEYQVVE